MHIRASPLPPRAPELRPQHDEERQDFEAPEQHLKAEHQLHPIGKARERLRRARHAERGPHIGERRDADADRVKEWHAHERVKKREHRDCQ